MSEFDVTAWWAPFLAFAAGIVAFASPCVLRLVPGYLSFVTAASEGPGSPSAPTRAHRTVAPRAAGRRRVLGRLHVARGVRRRVGSGRPVRDRPACRRAGGPGRGRLPRAVCRPGRVPLALRGASPAAREGAAGRGHRVPPRDGVRREVDALHRTGARRHPGARRDPVRSAQERPPSVRVLDGPGDPVRSHRGSAWAGGCGASAFFSATTGRSRVSPARSWS
jgi:hypothetical protein